MPKNTICLWFDHHAEEAARFYAATFPDSAVTAVHRAPADYPSGRAGDVLTVSFTVAGIPCLGLNGGPAFKPTEAFSFQIATEDQAETDRYWNAILDNGGTPSACGWCKDRWGLSWQITPRVLTEALAAGGAPAERAFTAMMGMAKIDVAAIQAAVRGLRVAATDTPAAAPLWADLRAALRGSSADYTRIPLKRAVLLLAVPMMLELVLESTFAVVDIFFVAQLGASAVATVGLTETYLFLLYSVAMGLAMAVTAIVARRIGEQRAEDATLSAVQAVWLAVLISVPVAAAGIFWAQDLLRLMGADAWAIEHGYRYTQWMLGGNVVILLLFVINAVFRGAGDAAAAMHVLWVANLLNIVLDPLLIFGWGPIPAMGIEGAAIATNIGRGAGVLMQLWILLRGSQHLRLSAASLRWHGPTLRHIARTSLGGIGQMVVAMTAWIFLMRILASLSTEAVAGATIAMRVMMFTLMPAWGMSNAAATLVGQNLGAGEPGRAEAAVWRIGWMNMAFTVAVSVGFFFWHDAIVGLFTDDPAVIRIGGEWLSILAWSYFVYGWWMVAVQAFNGAGDTMTPTWINLVFFWLIQIPLAWALALPLGWAHSGVFWGVFVSETAVGLFTLWLFSRGRWKATKV